MCVCVCAVQCAIHYSTPYTVVYGTPYTVVYGTVRHAQSCTVCHTQAVYGTQYTVVYSMPCTVVYGTPYTVVYSSYPMCYCSHRTQSMEMLSTRSVKPAGTQSMDDLLNERPSTPRSMARGWGSRRKKSASMDTDVFTGT